MSHTMLSHDLLALIAYGRGALLIRGDERLALLQRLCSRDIIGAPLNTPLDALFVSHQGRLVDWCTLWLRPEDVFVVCSANRAQILADFLSRYTIMEDVTYEVVAEMCLEFRRSTINNPPTDASRWPDVINTLLPGIRVQPPWAHTFLASHRGGMVAPGYRLDDAVYTKSMRDTAERLRIECGTPSPEFEFARPVQPFELRLDHGISWNKGCYVGQEVLSRLHSYNKVARLLMGFEGLATEQHGDLARLAPATLRLGNAQKIYGKITSLCARADAGLVGLAIVSREQAQDGQAAELYVAEDKTPLATVTLRDRPFWAPLPA